MGEACKEIARQTGLTVRAAMRGWPQTVRLVTLVAVSTVVYVIVQLL